MNAMSTQRFREVFPPKKIIFESQKKVNHSVSFFCECSQYLCVADALLCVLNTLKENYSSEGESKQASSCLL